jgi:hypothetical protein
MTTTDPVELVAELRAGVAPAARAQLARGRAHLLERIDPPARRRRPRARWAAVAVTGAAAAAIALTISPSGHHRASTARTPSLTLAAQVFLRKVAHRYAADANGQTEPSPGQWLYTDTDQTQNGQITSAENWQTFDSTKSSYWQDGQLIIHPVYGMPDVSSDTPIEAFESEATPMTAYELLASLPQSSSAALLRAVDADIAQYPDRAGWILPTEGGNVVNLIGGQTTPVTAPLPDQGENEFNFLAQLVWNSIVPPAGAEAAVFNAMATLPGVTITQGLTDAAGAPAVGISEDGGAGRLLFSPQTDQLVGLTTTEPTPEKTPGVEPTTTTSYSIAWATVAQVDAPGDR